MKIESPSGATPLDPNEIAGLIPTYITTRGELNALENENVLEAQAWALRKPRTDILNATFAFELHKRMFNRVWKWAGVQRHSDKNIGDVSWTQIPTALASLFGDTQYWIDHGSYPPDTIAARFHRRLVWIHAFADGNGRHARLMTDVLLMSWGQQPFSWGEQASAGLLHAQGSVREEYVAALKEADEGEHGRLLKFARS
jgi:Fic-DOC domain mobile mystery protein B